ncbi:MAG: RagB/SusD family nutrient uptake outer membrane protein [Flavisolibacter sp.]
MKTIFNKTMAGILLCLAILGCSKHLVEKPQSQLTPAFFTTAQGFQSGLDAAYAGMRNLWGTQNFFTMTCLGTDEFITGGDGNNDINKYNSNYTPNNVELAGIWNPCYTFINTCNGLIDNATVVTGISNTTKAEMVGEAKFLRAVYYFTLVQFWGDVTLNTHFQSAPTTSATRTPIAEVYKFIIQDLKDAIASLPPSPLSSGVLPGKANGAAATHLLAKVYLTRAGSSAKDPSDYQNAFQLSSTLIANKNSLGLGLQQDFGKIYAEGNESNNEVLWTIQHTSNTVYNGTNDLCYYWVPKYEILVPGMKRDVVNGRSYNRAVPTHWLTDTVFADKVNDTRYNKSFQTVWYCNNAATIPTWPTPVPAGVDPSLAGKPKFSLGDTACYMPGFDVSDAKIASTRYMLIPPRKYTIRLAPAMDKYFDTRRPDINATSIRPIIVWTLGETYLIAAESAYMLGNMDQAVSYINTIRERAAYPTGNAAAMDITAANLSLDFILDERSRELLGQHNRYWDLQRTGQLQARIVKHNIDAQSNFVSPKHLLRPIPQSQIDNTTSGSAYPQNPGW